MWECSRCDKEMLGIYELIDGKNVCIHCVSISEWLNINYPEEV